MDIFYCCSFFISIFASSISNSSTFYEILDSIYIVNISFTRIIVDKEYSVATRSDIRR